MSDELRSEHTETIPLPEGAIAQNAVLVVGYFDGDGMTRYGVRATGDSSLGATVGLLEIAKAHLLADHFNEFPPNG